MNVTPGVLCFLERAPLLTPFCAPHLKGLCRKLTDRPVQWSSTVAAKKHLPSPSVDTHTCFSTAEAVLLQNGDWCKSQGQWVLWHYKSQGSLNNTDNFTSSQRSRIYSVIGRVHEVLQLTDTVSAAHGKADLALVQYCKVEGRHQYYDMPLVTPLQSYVLVPIKVRDSSAHVHVMIVNHSSLLIYC